MLGLFGPDKEAVEEGKIATAVRLQESYGIDAEDVEAVEQAKEEREGLTSDCEACYPTPQDVIAHVREDMNWEEVAALQESFEERYLRKNSDQGVLAAAGAV